ncbi:ATP-binding protein [Alkalihalobacillus sp. BA299]|uniref:ATP-binding protein n=1 Tax=Alkalihalobacillus sp. BA299 TaxID=2815938 RepID=UPI001ADCCA15|nr:ATP-binding protein [Alkalihalobacillus sp. BA299]
MVVYLKDFLLNIFIILSPLVFYPYIHKLKNKTFLYRTMLGMLFSVILILIMSLPININGLIYDFRSIPVIIGSLYGGSIVSIFLFITLITYRFILGNPNNLVYAISLLPSLFLILFTLSKYGYLKVYQKVALAVVLSILMKMITFTLYLTYIQNLDLLINNFTESLQTYFVQSVVIGGCVYLIELLNKYFEMQDELYKSERIKMVSEMAASVAHEIRNPLTSVRGFIQLFSEQDLDKEKKELYQKICLEELSRADLIISDYLSLAKPDIEIFDNIEVNGEVRYLSNVLLTIANYNNIQIYTNYFEDEEIYISGDRQKFRQALINIGKNAIEAMQNGGVLEIKLNKESNNLVICIMDTGVGMTAEQIKRIGTPYYSTKEKGTGLGTMVSFSIIKKMNGKISIKSEVGKGTKYFFTFPLLTKASD